MRVGVGDVPSAMVKRFLRQGKVIVGTSWSAFAKAGMRRNHLNVIGSLIYARLLGSRFDLTGELSRRPLGVRRGSTPIMQGRKQGTMTESRAFCVSHEAAKKFGLQHTEVWCRNVVGVET